jgi:hypothetical protein
MSGEAFAGIARSKHAKFRAARGWKLDHKRDKLTCGLQPHSHRGDTFPVERKKRADNSCYSLSRTTNRPVGQHGRVVASLARQRTPSRVQDQRSAHSKNAVDGIRGRTRCHFQGRRGPIFEIPAGRRKDNRQRFRWAGPALRRDISTHRIGCRPAENRNGLQMGADSRPNTAGSDAKLTKDQEITNVIKAAGRPQQPRQSRESQRLAALSSQVNIHRIAICSMLTAWA